MDLKLGGFVHASGTMAIERSDVRFKLAGAAGTLSANKPTVDTRLLTIGGVGLNTFVGINGPYRDSSGQTNTDAVGVTGSNAEFGVALAWDKASSRSWVALQASADEVALVGVPGITATTIKLDVAMNVVNNPLSSALEREQVLDLAAQNLKVATGYATTTTLTLDGARGELLRASGDFDVGAAGFVHARGRMDLEKSTTTVQLADKSDVVVDQLLMGGSGLELFAGVGGPYRGDGNQTNPSAVGFAMTGGEFALAMFTPAAGQPVRYSGMRWICWLAAAQFRGKPPRGGRQPGI
jgi:hypothetical protein